MVVDKWLFQYAIEEAPELGIEQIIDAARREITLQG